MAYVLESQNNRIPSKAAQIKWLENLYSICNANDDLKQQPKNQCKHFSINLIN